MGAQRAGERVSPVEEGGGTHVRTYHHKVAPAKVLAGGACGGGGAGWRAASCGLAQAHPVRYERAPGQLTRRALPLRQLRVLCTLSAYRQHPLSSLDEFEYPGGAKARHSCTLASCTARAGWWGEL